MLKIALAQINPKVGDLDFNSQKIIKFSKQAYLQKAEVVVFPELSICGYPPEDLLLSQNFITQCQNKVEYLIENLPQDIVVIVGSVKSEADKIYNIAVAINNQTIIAEYKKQCLPNYGVFDELRYFTAGIKTVVFAINHKQCALTICEDLWTSKVANNSKLQGAEYIFNLNASPYQINKPIVREQTMRANVKGVNLVYVNQVGGQDELVFDGGSFVMNSNGEKVFELSSFTEQLQIYQGGHMVATKSDQLAEIYQALVLATKDYVLKNNFSKVMLGLSGGIDSALTLCVAVDALGAKNVEVIMMPSRFNLRISLEDAKKQAKTLNVNYQIVSIEPMLKSFLANIEFLKASQTGVTQENIQARIRGIILMARSNQTHAMLLTTGNKSEISVGYATLYGDMAGGFAPLKDVYKTKVYQLANWLNQSQEIIPRRVITRPPSAELADNQQDMDSLPDYNLLDDILTQYIEHGSSRQQIKELNLDSNWVDKITNLVDINEHKRRQSPPGVKISQRNYGKDRRYPIINGFKS